MGIDRGDAQKRFAFVITLDNDSMLPRYRRGAVLYIDMWRTPQIGDEVYVETGEPALALVGVLLSRSDAELWVKPYAADARSFSTVARIGRVLPPEEYLL